MYVLYVCMYLYVCVCICMYLCMCSIYEEGLKYAGEQKLKLFSNVMSF